MNLLENKDTEDKILYALKKTKESGREQGFTFCTGKGIRVGGLSEGSQASVNTGNCPNNSRLTGALHTHTFLASNGDILPSPSDVLNGIKLNFFCVAGSNGTTGIVRCFDKKNIENELHNIIKAKKGFVSEENMATASKLMISYMLKENKYLEKHSTKKIVKI